MTLIAPGTCRHCGCNEDAPCGYCRGVHGGCVWTDSGRLTCGDPNCIRAEALRRAKAKADAKPAQPRYPGWGYGAIVDDLRKRRRGQRRKGKAA